MHVHVGTRKGQNYVKFDDEISCVSVPSTPRDLANSSSTSHVSLIPIYM